VRYRERVVRHYFAGITGHKRWFLLILIGIRIADGSAVSGGVS
jgi:hypothetical protein